MQGRSRTGIAPAMTSAPNRLASSTQPVTSGRRPGHGGGFMPPEKARMSCIRDAPAVSAENPSRQATAEY